MKLTRIEMSGFKSFADTVALEYDEGVIAIVGPNGCGKSNISDAVRWVLGEQRARMLRSQRMEEVIFQGSAKRRPVNIAEVSIYFDNSEGSLPLPHDEVVITRRLSRNGLSEYLVNQNPVRLRDVHDLFRGTGLGGYVGAVIEAQMIDRLLSDRADERRALFEEAAGIGIYRDRKTTTERRLEQTAEDLHRLDDLITEVQTQVRSLARQRGKAERHGKMSERRFAIMMTLARFDLSDLDSHLARLRTRRGELEARIPQTRQQLTGCEQKREEAAQAKATADARRNEVERRLAATQIEIEKLEGELKLAGERLTNAFENKERAAEERAHVQERAAQAERERDAAAAERAAAESARRSVQMELDLRATTEDEARKRVNLERQRVKDLENLLQQQAERHRALAGERTAIELELEELGKQAGQLNQRRSEATSRLEEARTRLAISEQELRDAGAEARRLNNVLERAHHRLAAAREHEAALRVERRSAEEKMAQMAARREAIEELERERVGLAPAVKRLLDTRKELGDGIVIGPLSDFVTASPSTAQVVERILSEWMHAVLVRDDEAVERVRTWHAETRPGPLILLPIAPGPRRDKKAKSLELAQLTVAEPAREWIAALLAGNELIKEEGAAIRRVNRAVFLPDIAGASGPVSRRAEMDSLEAEISAEEEAMSRLTEQADDAAQAHESTEQALADATADSDRARAAFRECQVTCDDAGRQLQRAERDLKESDEAYIRINRRIEQRTQRLAEVDTEIAEVEQERVHLESELNSQRAGLGDLEEAQETARERRVHWQVEEVQVSARERSAREREERGDTALTKAREEIAGLENELRKIEHSIAESEQRRALLTDDLSERRAAERKLETAGHEAVQAVEAAEDAPGAAEAALEQARIELEEVTEHSHRLDIEETEVTGRKKSLVERVQAEWQRPLGELLESAPAVEGDPDELQREAQRLAEALAALGPVNPLAMHEHAEELKRLEFLKGQREDLVQARNALQQALREIDQTARAMFTETFASIRENFHTVFNTLFEGGECDVQLEDETDPLTSDIQIRAAPRGKRTQRIHLLSSGERALVAISLLFAIYLTKPSPFCLLDEVDAPLDDSNVARFVRLIEEFRTDTQFIVITHNPRTMQVADSVYGVTMQEPGVSSIVGVRLGKLEPV